MARIILNDVLCFLVKKLRTCTEKLLKTAVLDFYNVSTLNDAKHQLMKDIEDMKLPTSDIPHVPERREGDQRSQRIVDDILKLLQYLDGKLLIDKLPIYATDNPDQIPSQRVYEGDLGAIMVLLGKLDSKMLGYQGNMTAMHHRLDNLSAQLQTFTNKQQAARPPAVAQYIVDQQNRPIPSFSAAVQPHGQTGPVRPIRPGVHANTNTSCTTTSSTTQLMSTPEGNVVFNNNSTGLPAMSDNETIVKQPVLLSSFENVNRYTALMSTGESEVCQSDDNIPFTEVISARRRRRMKRRQDNNNDIPPVFGNETVIKKRPGARLLIGRGQPSSGNIVAAKRTSRCVLYIDNLSTECSTDELINFISNQSIEVFSCFKVKPRHRRGEEPDTTRSAFRLCIARRDLNTLLKEDLWPDNVTIAEWFHKQPAATAAETETESTSQVKRIRQDNNANMATQSADNNSNQQVMNSSSLDMDSTVMHSDVSDTDTVVETHHSPIDNESVE